MSRSYRWRSFPSLARGRARPHTGRHAEPRTAVEAADPPAAHRHFAGRLAVETDVADVAAALATGDEPGFVLLDARSPQSYAAGHLPGARLLPRPFAAEDVAALGDALLVVYCWGPACNGATKAALELAALGRPVKEMIGGFDYWERDGHAIMREPLAHQPRNGRPVD